MFQPKLSVLPRAQRWLWPRLNEVPPHFVLYGGTAIALRLGHRESVDYDFFSAQAFDPDELVARVPFLELPKTVNQSQRNTYTAVLRHSEGQTRCTRDRSIIPKFGYSRRWAGASRCGWLEA